MTEKYIVDFNGAVIGLAFTSPRKGELKVKQGIEQGEFLIGGRTKDSDMMRSLLIEYFSISSGEFATYRNVFQNKLNMKYPMAETHWVKSIQRLRDAEYPITRTSTFGRLFR